MTDVAEAVPPVGDTLAAAGQAVAALCVQKAELEGALQDAEAALKAQEDVLAARLGEGRTVFKTLLQTSHTQLEAAQAEEAAKTAELSSILEAGEAVSHELQSLEDATARAAVDRTAAANSARAALDAVRAADTTALSHVEVALAKLEATNSEILTMQDEKEAHLRTALAELPAPQPSSPSPAASPKARKTSGRKGRKSTDSVAVVDLQEQALRDERDTLEVLRKQHKTALDRLRRQTDSERKRLDVLTREVADAEALREGARADPGRGLGGKADEMREQAVQLASAAVQATANLQQAATADGGERGRREARIKALEDEEAKMVIDEVHTAAVAKAQEGQRAAVERATASEAQAAAAAEPLEARVIAAASDVAELESQLEDVEAAITALDSNIAAVDAAAPQVGRKRKQPEGTDGEGAEVETKTPKKPKKRAAKVAGKKAKVEDEDDMVSVDVAPTPKKKVKAKSKAAPKRVVAPESTADSESEAESSELPEVAPTPKKKAKAKGKKAAGRKRKKDESSSEELSSEEEVEPTPKKPKKTAKKPSAKKTKKK